MDYADIKERVSIDGMISLLDLRLKEIHPGEQWRGPCPCGKGDQRALVVTKSKSVFYCHGMKRGGDAIALVAHVKSITQREAATFIVEALGLESDSRSSQRSSPEPRSTTRTEPKGRREPLKPLDYLVSHHPALDVLGLSAAAIEALGGGFAGKGTMIGRILIPLRLPNGLLAGYLGIATRPDQMPLLKFPENLDERIVQPAAESEPPATEVEPTPEELRKMFRIVG